jgi:hypothetical protein
VKHSHSLQPRGQRRLGTKVWTGKLGRRDGCSDTGREQTQPGRQILRLRHVRHHDERQALRPSMSGKGGHGQRTSPGIYPTHCDTWSTTLQLAHQRTKIGEGVGRHISTKICRKSDQ